MRGAHLAVGKRTPIASGRTPAGARLLATVQSPSLARLIALTNTPSDNFFAETLLKDIGARLGGAGTTAAGAAVVRSLLASRFGIHPALVDGSGLSREDATSPFDVVTLLAKMVSNPYFTGSLAVAGRDRDHVRRDARHGGAGELPGQDGHAPRRREPGRLLHGGRRAHARVRVPGQRAG